MFESLRAAVVADATVELRVTDAKKHNGFCHASRIKIQDSPHVDVDSDGDGVPDLEDDVPLDASETVDTDDDGLGNTPTRTTTTTACPMWTTRSRWTRMRTPTPMGTASATTRIRMTTTMAIPDEDEVDDPPPTSFALATANGNARGIAHAAGRLYVVDWIDDKVYAYATDGARQSDFDFELHEDTQWAQSITHADGLFFVGIRDSDRNRVDAYTEGGGRSAGNDFRLTPRAPWWPSGITHTGGCS